MEVRKARLDDIETMLYIERANFKERAFSRRQFEGYIKKGHTYVVCVSSIVIGYCVVFVRSNSRTARINVISVDPKSTGHGLGTFLLTYIEGRYKNYDAIQLEVNVLNVHAIRLYKNRGYDPVATLRDYYGPGTTGIKMIKSLK
jgi:ribosomal protein S18 acetylase RimI-like enzyme